MQCLSEGLIWHFCLTQYAYLPSLQEGRRLMPLSLTKYGVGARRELALLSIKMNFWTLLEARLAVWAYFCPLRCQYVQKCGLDGIALETLPPLTSLLSDCWLSETDNLTLTPTSCPEWPAVQRWEKSQDLIFFLSLSFVILGTTISFSFHVNNWVQHYECLHMHI